MEKKTKFFASLFFWGLFIGLFLYIGILIELFYLKRGISKIHQMSKTKFNQASYIIFQYIIMGFILLLTLGVNILMFIKSF